MPAYNGFPGRFGRDEYGKPSIIALTEVKVDIVVTFYHL